MTGRFITFEITGSKDFPLSLLAAHSCFPATEADANLIKGGGDASGERTIRLKSLKLPLFREWEDEGWRLNMIRDSIQIRDEYDLYHTWPC